MPPIIAEAIFHVSICLQSPNDLLVVRLGVIVARYLGVCALGIGHQLGERIVVRLRNGLGLQGCQRDSPERRKEKLTLMAT
jgi:hypothetical protein